MLRILLPAFALISALVMLFAGAIGDRLGSFLMADDAVRILLGAPDRPAVQPRSDAARSASVASQSTLGAIRPDTAPEVLQRQVQTLQQQATALQEQLARRSQELDQQTHELARRTRDVQAAQKEVDRLRARGETAGQQRQADEANQQQLATRAAVPAQRAQMLDQGRESPEAALAEAERLRLVIQTLRQQEKAEEANPGRQKAEEPSLARQQAKQQPQPAKGQPQPAAPSKPPPTGSADVPSPVQRLMTARQWLAAGRPDEARRLLATVQTQLVLQPVTPEAPEARGTSAPAGDVGNAIRWLDLGAGRQAMQAINQAIEDSSGTTGVLRAWSGYPAYSGNSQSYGAAPYGTVDQR